eukprot:2497611-Pleurochrysis_carterae.AAC.2
MDTIKRACKSVLNLFAAVLLQCCDIGKYLFGGVGSVDHEDGKGVLVAGVAMNSFMRACLSAAAT